MKKLFKAISDKFMFMEGKNKDNLPLNFNKHLFDTNRSPRDNDTDREER